MNKEDKIISKFGSHLGTIIAQQALTISNLEVMLEAEKAKNAELQLQVKALRKDDNHGGSDTKHK